MAMFENEGFCPNNSFLHYVMEKQEELPEIWERTNELLGDRKGYMVYTEAGCVWHGYCYVVDCLVGATSTIGIEVATHLKTLIPNCKYAETGRKILVTDVINPYQIPGLCMKGETFVSSDGKVVILEDDRYVVGITDEGKAVHLYFFKKEKK